MKMISRAKSALLKKLYLCSGFEIRIYSYGILSYFELKKDLRRYKRQQKKSKVSFPVSKLFPVYFDKKDQAGSLSFHYFWQDLWVAQRIFANKPVRHIDIASRIDGFVSHLAAFRQVEIFDIRPLKVSIPNVTFTQANLMDSATLQRECTDSLSCLHALEHFGLGRYGDPIFHDGYLVGFRNLWKLLQPGGKLYFSVPMGPQRTEFHAHRVFSVTYLLEMIEPFYIIDKFSYIDDKNQFFEDVDISTGSDCNFGCHYGCAIFELTKK